MRPNFCNCFVRWKKRTAKSVVSAIKSERISCHRWPHPSIRYRRPSTDRLNRVNPDRLTPPCGCIRIVSNRSVSRQPAVMNTRDIYFICLVCSSLAFPYRSGVARTKPNTSFKWIQANAGYFFCPFLFSQTRVIERDKSRLHGTHFSHLFSLSTQTAACQKSPQFSVGDWSNRNFNMRTVAQSSSQLSPHNFESMANASVNLFNS